MFRYKIRILPVLVLVLFGCKENHEIHLAERGQIDLSNTIFSDQAVFDLNGQWEFYPNRIIDPENLKAHEAARRLATVPTSFNRYTESDLRLPAEASATYRLYLNLPAQIANYTFRLPSGQTASRFFINGHSEVQNGVVSELIEQVRAGSRMRYVQLPLAGKTEIVIQVSNADSHRGGISRPISVASARAMDQFRLRALILDIVVSVALMTFAFYHILLFLLRHPEPSSVYYGIFCLLVGTGRLFVGEQIFDDVFPSVPWGVRLRLEYLVNVLDAAFFVIYIRNFFAELRQKLVFKLLVFLSVLFSVATLILPQGVVRYLREPFQLDLAVMAPIAIVYLARLAFRNVYGARVLTLGVMGITAAFFNDALSSAEVISTPTVFSLAILAFTFLQAILISGKSVTLFYENAELSQKLLRSDKLRDEFLTQTSHELRTPVQAMVQTLENVRRGVSGAVSEQVQRTLAVIEENGRRLMYVIDDLTDFVRLKHSDIRLNVQTVSLKKIVHPILKLCLGLSENKQFALIDEIPEGLHDIQTDPSRLQQILLNLVSTAIRYSHSPAITVKLGTLHGQLAISVLYFGSDPDARFADVIDLPNEDVGPLVTQKLAQLLGGQYHYQKLAESHHALTITLPYQQISTLEVLLSSSHARTEYRKSDGDGLVSMPERLGDSPANSGGQVLLIGDNASQNRLLQDQLASLGKDSVIAKNGAEAMLQLQDREDIALVISDVLLSDVSGIELAMNIRASFDIGILPIILLIDNNQAGVAASAFSAGVNDLIRRPFEKAEVIARVKNVLLQREASLARENYRALNRELEIARSIQDSILPKANPGNENYKIEAVCLPARSIGGDFYDFLEEDGFIGVLIADVAGHGIPAALYAAMLKIALHNLRDQARFPEKLLKNLNDVMVERGERTFISCAYTMVDFKNRRLLHANAGHLPLLLQEPGKRAVKRVHPPGGVLGVRKAAAITVEMQHFLPKTRLLLFTDGVIELANKNGDFFEESRLISLLEDMREQPIVEVRDRLLAEMRGFSEGGTFLDDVTFIIIDL